MASDETPQIISNLDVMKALEGRESAVKKGGRPIRLFQHRDWIQSKVVAYLQSTPCKKLDDTRHQELQKTLQSQKRMRAENGSSKLSGFGLTEAEAVQVLNLAPTEPVEIHLVVEELQNRLDEEQQNHLLQLVRSHLRGDADKTSHSTTESEQDGQFRTDVIKEDTEALNGVETTQMIMEAPASSQLLAPVKQESS